MRTHRVKVIVSGDAVGKVLKSDLPLSFLGGIDPQTGLIVEEGHPLRGKAVARQILALPHSKGSTVGSYVLYSLSAMGLAPSAILIRKMDTIVAVGCVLGGIPLAIVCDRLWGKMRNGMRAKLDSDSSSVTLSERYLQ